MAENDREFRGMIVGFAGYLCKAAARAATYSKAAELMVYEWKQGDVGTQSDDETETVTVFVVDTDGRVKPCHVQVRVKVTTQASDADVPVPDDVTRALAEP